MTLRMSHSIKQHQVLRYNREHILEHREKYQKYLKDNMVDYIRDRIEYDYQNDIKYFFIVDDESLQVTDILLVKDFIC